MKVAGCDAILSITGYTGSGGCEIYAANEDGDKLWALWEAGEEFGLKNIGLGARDTLRRGEACLDGNDIEDARRRVAARSGGLGWITKFAKGTEFIDRPSAGEAEGRVRRDPQAGGIQDDRPRHSAPRQRDRRHPSPLADRPCHFAGYDVALR